MGDQSREKQEPSGYSTPGLNLGAPALPSTLVVRLVWGSGIRIVTLWDFHAVQVAACIGQYQQSEYIWYLLYRVPRICPQLASLYSFINHNQHAGEHPAQRLSTGLWVVLRQYCPSDLTVSLYRHHRIPPLNHLVRGVLYITTHKLVFTDISTITISIAIMIVQIVNPPYLPEVPVTHSIHT